MTVETSSAGRRGSKVRSDAWVSITPRSSGGVELHLQSKVEALYGDAIRELMLSGAEHFGLEHAVIEVEDQGALPFVLMARFEAAVRRLDGFESAKPWLPQRSREFRESPANRMRRSRLYLPGNEPKYMLNAAVHGGDGLIFDLEDSVAPSEKHAARYLVRNALIHLDAGECEKMVRINQGEMGLADLEHIVPYGVELILVPKVEAPEELVKVQRRIEELMPADQKRTVWLMPIVESAKGAWYAYEIASAVESVVALAIGLEDYTADIGAQRTLEGRESFWARSQVLNGARAAGVQPIDTVFSDVNDMEGLRQSVEEAKSLGFVGKGCIHPRQIPVVHQAFAPTEGDIAKARRIVLAFEEAERQGLGVVSLGSKMIDPPVVKRALHTIELAEAEGLLTANWREE